MNEDITESHAKRKLKELFTGSSLDGFIEASKCKSLTEFTGEEKEE